MAPDPNLQLRSALANATMRQAALYQLAAQLFAQMTADLACNADGTVSDNDERLTELLAKWAIARARIFLEVVDADSRTPRKD